MIEIAIGLGFQRGIRLATLNQAIDSLLESLGPVEVLCLASHLQKSTEPALLELARIQGWPLRLYPSAALARVPVANVSERLCLTLGTPSVAEAAALLAASELSTLPRGKRVRDQGGSGARVDRCPSPTLSALLIPKRIYRGADGKSLTLAAARVERQQPYLPLPP